MHADWKEAQFQQKNCLLKNMERIIRLIEEKSDRKKVVVLS